MLQAIQTQTQVQPQILAPSQVQTPQPLKEIEAHLAPQDQITFSGGISDEEALAALNFLKSKYGKLYKPGFFSNKEISVQDALNRLKSKDKVLVKNKLAKNIKLSDYMKTIDDLMRLDDLQGRKQDHGVTKAEFRLPLLFLEGKKLQEYNYDDDDFNDGRLDLYNAYKELDRNWRIYVEGKAVKPKDMASYVVNKGWTATKDPGLAQLNRFKKLPGDGWKVNGRDVNRDVAYMAFITGSTRIQFKGASVSSPKDFDILMSLVANEQNNALNADLRSRLTALKVTGFQAPGIYNLYNVYQHLSAGQTLSYQGNHLSSLDDVVVYDALLGSQKPTNLLAADVQDALLYLSSDQGLSSANAYKAWQTLGKGEQVTYSFAGGPTGEGYRLSAFSLADAVTMKAEVVRLRERDKFRPELGEAKKIFGDRLPGFDAPVADNLQRSLDAAERARLDIPVQEAKKAEAQRDYNATKPVHDRAYAEYQSADREADAAEQTYRRAERNYDWEKSKYDRIYRDYQRAERNMQSAERNARSSESSARNYENQARRSEGLASSDPKNADKHRRDAQSYRSKAQQARNQASQYRNRANQYRNEMQRHRRDLDFQRWDVDRAQREMDRARRVYYDARSERDVKKSEWQRQKNLLDDAQTRLSQAERKLDIAHRTIADTDTIKGLTLQIQNALAELGTLTAGLKSYDDYQRHRGQLHRLGAEIRSAFADNTYTRVHGQQLKARFVPLMTLLNNMDKPAG